MFKGRIFDDTWGGRKTASAMMETPLDILEHVFRLQNGGGDVDHGKQYDSNIEIKTTGLGGIDEIAPSGAADATGYTEGLWTPADLRPARQLFEERDCWTDALATDLCRSFFLLNYQDTTGRECVSYLFDDADTIEDITFADIVGDVGDVIEPAPADVFVEPYINYAYDYALGKYTKQLRITNATADTYSANYTAGYSGTDGQPTWDLCRQLWLKTKQINPMPESLVNQPWIVRYEDAVWYLRKLSEWMGKRRIEFTVPYQKSAGWAVGSKIKLKLPHHTAGAFVNCLIEGIRRRKQQSTAAIKVVLLTDIPTTFFFE